MRTERGGLFRPRRIDRAGKRSEGQRPIPIRPPMLFLRSLAFNVAFYAHLILWLVLLIPVAALPRRGFMPMRQALGAGSRSG